MTNEEDRKRSLGELVKFVRRIPAIVVISSDVAPDGRWWIKFQINIHHELAWNVVQELGHVLNYLSMTQRLPTVFMPVSAPPYLNGGPEEFLYWVIEAHGAEPIDPLAVIERLEFAMPKPVENAAAWLESR